MISFDDCGPGALRKFARYATPRQLAEAKHRIAEQDAEQAHARSRTASDEAVAAARRVKAWFAHNGNGEQYALLFLDARMKAIASNAAFSTYVRLRKRADTMKRAIDYQPTERAS